MKHRLRIMNRRTFLKGSAAVVAAPLIVTVARGKVPPPSEDSVVITDIPRGATVAVIVDGEMRLCEKSWNRAAFGSVLEWRGYAPHKTVTVRVRKFGILPFETTVTTPAVVGVIAVRDRIATG